MSKEKSLDRGMSFWELLLSIFILLASLIFLIGIAALSSFEFISFIPEAVVGLSVSVLWFLAGFVTAVLIVAMIVGLVQILRFFMDLDEKNKTAKKTRGDKQTGKTQQKKSGSSASLSGSALRSDRDRKKQERVKSQVQGDKKSQK